jgi:DNA invertase Pin-like site-specific DNA recombinase
MKEIKFSSTDPKENIARLPDRTVAIYVRVSHSSQVDNFSIPTQIQEYREYIRKEKFKEVGIFIEEGESAKTSDRTQLSNLLKFISRNKDKVDYVLVYKIDRWARSQSDFFAIKSMLLKNGTNLISVCENVDDSPTGRFLEGVFSGLAQLDNELKGERVKACLATKASDGQYPGKPPYGYINDTVKKILIKDSVYFDSIKWALNSFSNGTPIPVIAQRFNLMDIKTRGANKTLPRDFKSKDIWNILCKSKFYAGYYDWVELKNVEGKHERMINWMTHLKIQSMLFNKKWV